MNKRFTTYGLNFYGLVWIAEAVVGSFKVSGMDGAKKWAPEIKSALKEAPKKYRREQARILASQIARLKGGAK